ncbi:hypothetical protein AQI95_28875 [Streptomyces yokosukanensis]|uniref:Cysteine dioxygenase n=1 Tax=Streptomyces yokosukanensis TaxID=67386 RepID=A0A124HEX5_9ACTN|nr:hypothetical protein [Streptomyces yokosukanensis]KUN02094.1 hypothetical protein AQI95_28875 [Streptomyces yokosukanensis]
MEKVHIIPGLTVDREMYESALAGLAEHAHEQTLTWARFTSEDAWTLVPDPDGFGYKAELVLRRSADVTIKVNLWRGPDLRDGERPTPHGHPWPFTAHVLLGGYDEQRYGLLDGKVSTTTMTHRAGGANHLPLHVFHEVTRIHEPGRTVTLMICGKGTKGDWGYLDPETGTITPNQDVSGPTFRQRMVAINPRMQKIQ